MLNNPIGVIAIKKDFFKDEGDTLFECVNVLWLCRLDVQRIKKILEHLVLAKKAKAIPPYVFRKARRLKPSCY